MNVIVFVVKAKRQLDCNVKLVMKNTPAVVAPDDDENDIVFVAKVNVVLAPNEIDVNETPLAA